MILSPIQLAIAAGIGISISQALQSEQEPSFMQPSSSISTAAGDGHVSVVSPVGGSVLPADGPLVSRQSPVPALVPELTKVLFIVSLSGETVHEISFPHDAVVSDLLNAAAEAFDKGVQLVVGDRVLSDADEDEKSKAVQDLSEWSEGVLEVRLVRKRAAGLVATSTVFKDETLSRPYWFATYFRRLDDEKFGTPNIWDATTGEYLFSLQGHDNISFIVFSPDGSSVLTVCEEDGTANIWSALDGTRLWSLPGVGQKRFRDCESRMYGEHF